jgi:type I restriction enzyme M protein
MKSDSYANIEELEPDLWEVSANLRANSKLSSIDYFMPVLGMIFLRRWEPVRGSQPTDRRRPGQR